MSTATPSALFQIPEGRYTHTIYSYIRDSKFTDVIKILSAELDSFPKSRAALSLLAYCHYQVQDYATAADRYEQLVQYFPDVAEYRLYYAQSLYKSGQYQPAQKGCQSIDNPEFGHKVLCLQAAIKYETNDLAGCKLLIDQSPQDDPETMINQGCLLYKEGKFAEACAKYGEALKITGYNAELSYNIALCHYQLKKFVPSLKYIADIIEKGIRDHPELSVGMATEGIDVRSVGNSQTLHETYLIEAFNLKAAIEYHLKNYEAAREALTDMPPRQEEELDHVTLSNSALMNMEEDPTTGFEKFNFLLQQSPCPPEVFSNLILLYIKFEYYDLAADLLADNQVLVNKSLSPEYLDATLLRQSSPEESYRKFDDMSNKHVETLRKLTKQVQEARQNHNDELVKQSVNEYDEAILDVTAIVLANLCVSYIMTSQNEEAEDLMRRIEKEEERVTYEDNTKRTYHLCIVNLLGTDTWYYAKRCFASLYETLTKHMILLKDSVFTDALQFFDNCELYGRDIPVLIDPVGMENIDPSKNSVSYEARRLKALFLKLYE
ncbi:Tetratricopeptide repeat protein 30A [Clydaea vesicula]|uniref:Tetratricopeptide repeat protein 30A n=1 Tax=Clydaea vesicula TaxID=447962 RepID=A0AAD5U8A5_9FUNG|nr:Tetratricopeptide repeat protein 30A [Clydaea vesicula]